MIGERRSENTERILPKPQKTSRSFEINKVETRRDTFDGREHLVVPVVAVREGVLNGMLLLFEEFSAYPSAWEGIPLPVNHPKKGSSPVSANTPDILQSAVLGRFFNIELDEVQKSLKGEMWIDILKAQAHADGPEIIQRLEAGDSLEVSTAYFADLEDKAGVFNGKNYDGIQRNLRPDHLALLPHSKGACSWDDGCGAPRLNEVKYLVKDENGAGHLPYTKDNGMPDHRLMGAAWAALHGGYRGNKYGGPDKAAALKKLKALYKKEGMPLPSENVLVFAANEKAVIDKNQTSFTLANAQSLSFDEITCEIRDALNAENPAYYYWIQDVYDAFVVYQSEPRFNNPDMAVEPVLTMRNYSIDAEGKITFGKSSQVERQISYVKIPANNSQEQPKEKTMDKKQIVDALINDDKTPWKEEHRVSLMTLAECELTKLKTPAAPAPGAPAANAAGEPKKEDPPAAPKKEEPKTAEQWLDTIPDKGIRTVLQNGLKAQAARKTDLVKEIMANKNNAFAKEELEGMEVAFLEKFANTIGIDYAGAAPPRANDRARVTENDDEPPAPPQVLTAPVEVKK